MVSVFTVTLLPYSLCFCCLYNQALLNSNTLENYHCMDMVCKCVLSAISYYC